MHTHTCTNRYTHIYKITGENNIKYFEFERVAWEWWERGKEKWKLCYYVLIKISVALTKIIKLTIIEYFLMFLL